MAIEYKPWRSAPRNLVKQQRLKDFRRNAPVVRERERNIDRRLPSQVARDRLDETFNPPVEARPPEKKGGGGLWGKVKGAADAVTPEFAERGAKTGLKGAIAALDATSEYTLRPAFGQLFRGSDRKEILDEQGRPTGQYYRTRGKLGGIGDVFEAGKELLTSNPIDSYQEGRQAFHERMADPKLPKAYKTFAEVAADPTLYIGPGVAKAGLRGLGRPGRAAAEVIATPKGVSAGILAGTTAESVVGDQIPGWNRLPEGARSFAAGLAGGVAGGSPRARRLSVQGVSGLARQVTPAAMIDAEHPDFERYFDAATRRGIGVGFDENGVMTFEDPDAMKGILDELEARAQLGMAYRKDDSSNVTVGEEVRYHFDRNAPRGIGHGKVRVKRGEVKKRLERGRLQDDDYEAIFDAERVREAADLDSYPGGDTEDARTLPWEAGARLTRFDVPEPPLAAYDALVQQSKRPGKAGAQASEQLGDLVASRIIHEFVGPEWTPRKSYYELLGEESYLRDAWARRVNPSTSDKSGSLTRAQRRTLARLQEAADELNRLGHDAGSPRARRADRAGAATVAASAEDPGSLRSAGETVKRGDIFGNTVDTFKTERELNGWGRKADQPSFLPDESPDAQRLRAWERAQEGPARQVGQEPEPLGDLPERVIANDITPERAEAVYRELVEGRRRGLLRKTDPLTEKHRTAFERGLIKSPGDILAAERSGMTFDPSDPDLLASDALPSAEAAKSGPAVRRERLVQGARLYHGTDKQFDGPPTAQLGGVHVSDSEDVAKRFAKQRGRVLAVTPSRDLNLFPENGPIDADDVAALARVGIEARAGDAGGEILRRMGNIEETLTAAGFDGITRKAGSATNHQLFTDGLRLADEPDFVRPPMEEDYEEAVSLAMAHPRVSAAMIQRRTGVKASRAQEILNKLAEDGLVAERGGESRPSLVYLVADESPARLQGSDAKPVGTDAIERPEVVGETADAGVSRVTPAADSSVLQTVGQEERKRPIALKRGRTNKAALPPSGNDPELSDGYGGKPPEPPPTAEGGRTPRPDDEPPIIEIPGGERLSIEQLRDRAPMGYFLDTPRDQAPRYRRALTKAAMDWKRRHPAPPALGSTNPMKGASGDMADVGDAVTSLVYEYHPSIADASMTLSDDWRRVKRTSVDALAKAYLRESGFEDLDEIRRNDPAMFKEIMRDARKAGTAAFKTIETDILRDEFWSDIREGGSFGAGVDSKSERGMGLPGTPEPALPAGEPPRPELPPEGVGPGNPQWEFRQEGTGDDLLELGDRDSNIAGELAYRGTRAGKVDTKVRSIASKLGAKGIAPNLERDDVLSPVGQGLNKAQNKRRTWAAVGEQLWSRLERAGFQLEQDELGNWRHQGHFVRDMVEGNSAEAAAAFKALPTEQRGALLAMVDLLERATKTAERYGADSPKVETPSGRYWGSVVVAKAGQAKNTFANRSRSVGAKRGFQKQRTGQSATANADGLKEIVYAHPRDEFMAKLDEKLRAGQDAWAKLMLAPLAKKEAAPDFGYRGSKHPGLAGLNFENETAERIDALLDSHVPNAIEKVPAAMNRVLTPVRASLDASATFQQGMKMWVTNPSTAAKGWTTVVKSLKDPEKYLAAVDELDAKGPGIEYWAKKGLRVTAEGEPHELTLPKADTGLAEKPYIGRAVRAWNKVAGISAEHFDRLLNVYRLESANREYALAVKRGLSGEQLDAEMAKASRAINRAFGWSDNRPSSIESIGLFAPRYFRASIETLGKAATDKGIEGQIARSHMRRLLATGAAFAVTWNSVKGEETEFRPWKPNFLRLRDVGGLDVSLFGTYDTLVRMIASTAWEQDPKAPLRLIEGKLSPAMSNLWFPLKGETYLGEPLDPLGDPLGTAYTQGKSVLPFGAQNLVEEGIENRSVKEGALATVVGGAGLTNRPMTPAERRDRARESQARELFGKGYGALTGQEKARVNETGAVSRWQKEQDRRALRKDDDFAKGVEVRQTIKRELDASARYLAAGRDDQGRRYSGEDFRKAYNETMLRAAGARALLDDFDGEDEAVDGWFDLYEQARMENGQTDYDLLERLQVEYERAHPDIRERIEAVVGIHDNAAVRELRQARKAAAAYYQLPAYRGMSVEDAERASEVLGIANDLVSFGEARNRQDALRILRREDPEGVRLARIAAVRGSNPARAKMRRENPLFAKFYSSISSVSGLGERRAS